MTKKDLRDGMIVETHGFGSYVVMDGCKVARNIDGFIKLDDQNDDLTYVDDAFTIDKVYANNTGLYSLENMFKHPGTVLWERTTVKEMTLEEIEKELGYKVKLIDNTPKREFKVGDKVRTTNLNDPHGNELFAVGSVCTIKRIYDDAKLPYLLEDEDGETFFYNADMFEPCERTFKVGDTVRIRHWDDMKEEFGLDYAGDIKCRHSFLSDMKHLCGRKCKINAIDVDEVMLDFADKAGSIGWIYSTDMIEHV